MCSIVFEGKRDLARHAFLNQPTLALKGYFKATLDLCAEFSKEKKEPGTISNIKTREKVKIKHFHSTDTLRNKEVGNAFMQDPSLFSVEKKSNILTRKMHVL